MNLDEDLLVAARQLAASTRRSLGDVLDDALRVFLAARGPERARERVSLPTYGGGGLQPGVDLEDKDGLAELLDENAPR